MAFIYLVSDRYRKVDDFHNVFYTLSAIECSGVKNSFQALLREVIISGSPGNILFCIYIENTTDMGIPVIHQLLVGFKYSTLRPVFCRQPD